MQNLIQIFVDNIFPILIIAGVSFYVGRQLNLDTEVIGQLLFYLLSPVLAFYLLYTSEIEPAQLGSLFLAIWLFQITMAAMSFAILRWRNVEKVDRSTVMLATFCLNAGNYGLSLVSFAFGEKVLALAAVVFLGNLIVNYTLGVVVASSGRRSLGASLKGVFRVPAVYAIPAALLARAFLPELPLFLMRSIKLVSDATIPTMLILLGLQLNHASRIKKIKLVGVGVFLKMFIAPFVAVAIALVFQMDVFTRAAFITQASTPSAVITLVFASEYDLDRDLSLSLILISTLISPITLSVVIYFMQQML